MFCTLQQTPIFKSAVNWQKIKDIKFKTISKNGCIFLRTGHRVEDRFNILIGSTSFGLIGLNSFEEYLIGEGIAFPFIQKLTYYQSQWDDELDCLQYSIFAAV